MASVVALLQLNLTVGDLVGNKSLIEKACNLAYENGATLAITSELAISGYPPRDLLLQDGFSQACIDNCSSIDSKIPLIAGTPLPPDEGSLPFNGAILVDNGKNSIVAKKILLPTYDVFDEARYFSNGEEVSKITIDGKMFGITICEDAWQNSGQVPSNYKRDPIKELSELESLEFVVNLSSSPFHSTKDMLRRDVAKCAASTLELPFLLVNQYGGNDDLLFDGRSLAAWPDGTLIKAPPWSEGILVVNLEEPELSNWISIDDSDGNQKRDYESDEKSKAGELLDAITVGLRDYCAKSGLKEVVLGLSGGIDSAVAACVAARALGPENVLGISIPSRHSSQHSIDDAKFTAKSLDCEYMVIDLEDLHQAGEKTLEDELNLGDPIASENIQARLRGLIVMGIANARGAMAIATGNKSELAQGYCTLYGDMAGGYAPIGDLYKTEVYSVAKEINSEYKLAGKVPPISESTLTKPPSAELAPNQKDQDTLPEYEILDQILRCYIEDLMDESTIVSNGFDQSMVKEVLGRLERNEHKRWQMPPAPRVSERAFGQGWRQPLASKRIWK